MAVQFVKISSPEPVVAYVADAISAHLRAGERVLWLVSGGSVLKVAAAAARKLANGEAAESLGRLTVSLTDERPGPVGHSDSNWLGLEQAGFELPGAKLHPVLTGASSAADTVAFAGFLEDALRDNQFTTGLFGIGPDGHTAGLPAQNAAASKHLADYYEAGEFHRISSTPAGIARLTEAQAYVVGENKRAQLDRFASRIPYSEQSAQALKLAPKLTVFNDYKGEQL